MESALRTADLTNAKGDKQGKAENATGFQFFLFFFSLQDKYAQLK